MIDPEILRRCRRCTRPTWACPGVDTGAVGDQFLKAEAAKISPMASSMADLWEQAITAWTATATGRPGARDQGGAAGNGDGPARRRC